MSATATRTTSPEVLIELSEFLYDEAELLDEHRYDEWVQLWTDDGTYWVPGASDGVDPETEVNLIYDDRRRIDFRAARVGGKWVLSQDPRSRMFRAITNIRVVSEEPTYTVRSLMTLTEVRRGEQMLWVGRVTHELVRNGDGRLRMSAKTVDLINRREELPAISFIP